MHPTGGGEPSDFPTSALFHDAVYEREALSLPESESEDDLDQNILDEALRLGIQVPQHLSPGPHDISTALSTITVSSEPRSSISIRSHESHSTGFTSDPSRNSKDHYVDVHPASPSYPKPRSSVSIENYDATTDVPRTIMRHVQSASATLTTGPTASLSLIPERPGIKRRRGSSLLSMFRREPQHCSSCPAQVRHGHHVNPFTPRLACGHTLTKYAVRIHVQDAIERGDNAPPSCCARPLPRSLIDLALTKAEVDSLAKQLPLLGREMEAEIHLTSSDPSVMELNLPTEPHSPVSPGESGPPTPLEKTPEECARLEKAMEDEQFRSLRAQQEEQFRRIVAFEAKQRLALASYHESTRTRLSSALAHNKAEKVVEHAQDLEQLEETQVAAEHDLRRAQVQEVQNVATALKYMEAYCNGPHSIEHTVSEDDRKKLKRQHAVQENLPRKHDSAINVLRSKQEKDVKVRLQNQHTELIQMDLDFEKENQQLEMRYHKDSSKLDILVEIRRRKAIARWELKVEIWRKQFEKQHEIAFEGSLPHPDWPVTLMEESAGDTSALVQYFQLPHHTTVAT